LEAGGGEATVEKPPSVGCLTDETDYFRLDHPGVGQTTQYMRVRQE
jgi:hypothetical protein